MWTKRYKTFERTKRLGEAIGDVASSDSLNITDTFDHIGDVQKALALNDKGKTINILENQQNYSQEQIDKALNDYAQIYASVYGINIENAKMAVLNGKYGSTYTNKDNTNSNIYLDKGNNQNALDTANTLGHEVAHVRQNQGQTYLRDTLQLQEEYANLFGNYSSSGLDFSSYVYNNVKLDSNKINSLNSINDLYALYQNSVAYKKDVAKVNSGDGKIDDLCVNSMDCYGNKTQSEFKNTVSQKADENLGKYDLINKINPNTNEIEFYSLYNEETGNIINLKPQELENLKLMAKSNPDIFNNLMAVAEMQSNTTHTSNNTVFGLHDDAYLGGLIDSYSKYFQSGEFVFDFLPVGVASKVVKTNTNLSTKVVDDVGLKLPTNYYPSNNGFIGEIDRVYLMPKTLIDRYGKNTGSYVSPIGTPFEMRALPNEAKNL